VGRERERRGRERERKKWVHNSEGKKYLDAEVPFTGLQYEQIRPAFLSVPGIEI
jgi:hypothetical protein